VIFFVFDLRDKVIRQFCRRICTRFHMLLINLQLVGDLLTYYTCTFDTHTHTLSGQRGTRHRWTQWGRDQQSHRRKQSGTGQTITGRQMTQGLQNKTQNETQTPDPNTWAAHTHTHTHTHAGLDWPGLLVGQPGQDSIKMLMSQD